MHKNDQNTHQYHINSYLQVQKELLRLAMTIFSMAMHASALGERNIQGAVSETEKKGDEYAQQAQKTAKAAGCARKDERYETMRHRKARESTRG
jgi:hypothetical protein